MRGRQAAQVIFATYVLTSKLLVKNTLNHTSSRMDTPAIEMKSKSMADCTTGKIEGNISSLVLINTFTKVRSGY